MSVSDYSPKRNERKKDRKISKWAQFMESIELMSKEHETTDSQTPEKDSLFNFMRKDLERSRKDNSSPSTSSAKVITEPRVDNRVSKSLASTPRRAIKCFEMPKFIDKKDKSISPTAAIEENLMKIMMALPKRRSSTPSTKITQKRISDLRKSGAKTDSENDDVFVKMEGKSQVICDTPDNIIITKTAPSVEKFLRYSSSSTDDFGCDR